jgi:RIP metalloprotease RseP
MTSLLSALVRIGQLLLALSLLVFIHELGHYFFARLFRVRVDKFYLFFDLKGKALWRYRPKGSATEYGIGWLPLGGYCKIHGMIDESLDKRQMEGPVRSDEFRSRPAWQRFLIMIGGVLFNFILALLIYTGMSYHWGDVTLSSRSVTAGMIFSPAAQEVGFCDGDIIWSVDGREEDVLRPDFMRSVIEANEVTVLRDGELVDIAIPRDMMQRILRDNQGMMSMQVPLVVDSVVPGGAASQAGVYPGDQLLVLDSIPMGHQTSGRSYFYAHAGEWIQSEWLRAGDTLRMKICPDTMGLVGVVLRPLQQIYDIKRVYYSLPQSIQVGWSKGIATLTGYARDMKYVFTPEGASSLGGLVSMGKLFPAHWEWYAFWQICALLSVIFAFMNLIPIPGLDGGHILFVLWEMITGRKVSDRVLLRAQMVGMMILFALIIYANANDLIKLF